MLLISFELIVICFIPISFNIMNILKDSLFSSASKGKSKKSTQNESKNYKFHQTNDCLSEPLLSTFEDNDIELGTIDSDEDSKSNNAHIVRTRHSRRTLTSAVHDGGSIVIVEKTLLPNETIQAFAIRYRVPVSQLKRLNNLQNDQDFYALTYCRVPVRRFGLLHEPSSTTIDLNQESSISLPVTHLSQQNHHAFLNAMDQDLALMRTKVEQLIETTPSSPNRLLSHSLAPRMIKPATNPTNELNCDGADCGCRLWHIVFLIILVALIPIICAYIYIKSHS